VFACFALLCFVVLSESSRVESSRVKSSQVDVHYSKRCSIVCLFVCPCPCLEKTRGRDADRMDVCVSVQC
jgi:hypothetical protein